MSLQQILDDLTTIANRPASIQQLNAFQKTATQLLYAPGDDDDDNRPLVFATVTINQLDALENSTEIENPIEFQQIILFLNNLFQDHTRPISIRLLAAKMAFIKYQTTIPGSGLPLDHSHIKGCLQWGHRVLDAKIIGSQFEASILSMKTFPVEWLSGLYSRRSANALAAECYAQLGLEALNSSHCKYFDVEGAQRQCIAYYKEAITDSHTLRSPEVKALIRAFKIHIAFCKNVPEDKKTYSLHISPAGALQLVNALRRGEEMPPVIEGGATTHDEDIEEGIGPIIEGTALWKNSERWDAERTSEKASGHLGKLFAKIPSAPGEKPDYKQAAQWIYAARHSASYVDLSEELKIPEIQAELKALKNPTSAAIFCNANNPAAPQHDAAQGNIDAERNNNSHH